MLVVIVALVVLVGVLNYVASKDRRESDRRWESLAAGLVAGQLDGVEAQARAIQLIVHDVASEQRSAAVELAQALRPPAPVQYVMPDDEPDADRSLDRFEMPPDLPDWTDAAIPDEQIRPGTLVIGADEDPGIELGLLR